MLNAQPQIEFSSIFPGKCTIWKFLWIEFFPMQPLAQNMRENSNDDHCQTKPSRLHPKHIFSPVASCLQ